MSADVTTSASGPSGQKPTVADLAARVRQALDDGRVAVMKLSGGALDHPALDLIEKGFPALDVLTERLATAEQERDERFQEAVDWCRAHASQIERAEAAEQDNERLREALERVASELDDAMKAAVNADWSQEDYDNWDAARELARAVLGSVPPHEETAT